MQTGITTTPNSNQNKSQKIPHTTDKNRIDEIPQTSEAGRVGEGSTYIPPSLRTTSPDQEYPDGPSTGSGEYGLDQFLDKGAIGSTDDGSTQQTQQNAQAPMPAASGRSSIQDEAGQASLQKSPAIHQLKDNARRSMQTISTNVRERAGRVDQSVKMKPYAYALGAFGVGFAIARIVL